jgi:hypothetical protein
LDVGVLGGEVGVKIGREFIVEEMDGRCEALCQ